jgi:hypothetical protein
MRSFGSIFMILGLSLIFSGCALTPVNPEFVSLGGSLSAKAANPSESKVLIFNNSSKLMFGFDGTGKMNVSMNGKGVASLNIGEYVQIGLPKGKHTMSLVHRDVVEFSSTHEISVENESTYIEIAASVVSNSFKVHPELPTGNALPSPFVPIKN